MSFGGSVAAMLSSLRHNKRERVSRFDKEQRKKEEIQGMYGKLEDHTRMDPYAFGQFKKKLEREAKKEEQTRRVALLIISLVVISTLGYFLYLY